MANSTDTFIMDMRARTAKLEKDLDAANKKIRAKMQRSGRMMASQMTASFAKVGAALGVGVGIGGLVTGIRDAVEAGSLLQTTAGKIDLTTGSLQGLRVAADRFNIAARTSDMAMQRFSRRLGEADQGTGELLGTLKQYNIETRDGTGNIREMTDVLFEYADVVSGAESGQERLRLGFKAFDSEGAGFVNVLRDGADGLARMTVEAYELGQVLESEQIARLNEANQAVKRFKQTWSTFFADLVASGLNMTDALGITGLENELDRLADRIRKIPPTMAVDPSFLFNSTAFSGGLGEDLEKLQLEFDMKLAELVRNTHEAGKRLRAELNNALRVQEHLEDMDGPHSSLIQRRIDKLTESLIELGKEDTKLFNKYPGAIALSQELAMAEDGLRNSRSLTAEETSRLNSILASTKTELERYKENVALLGKAMEALPARAEEIQDAIGDLATQYAESLKPDALDRMADAWEDMSKRMSGGLSDALIQGEDALDGFLDRMLSKLASAALEAAVIAPILSALGFGDGGFFSNIFGGNGLPSFDGGTRNTGNGPRSGGLDGKGGFLAMMHPQETVTDHTSVGHSGMAPITINQTLRFDVGLESVEERIQGALPAFTAASVSAVHDIQRRRP